MDNELSLSSQQKLLYQFTAIFYVFTKDVLVDAQYLSQDNWRSLFRNDQKICFGDDQCSGY